MCLFISFVISFVRYLFSSFGLSLVSSLVSSSFLYLRSSFSMYVCRYVFIYRWCYVGSFFVISLRIELFSAVVLYGVMFASSVCVPSLCVMYFVRSLFS